MRIQGGCHCGKVSFEAEADPEKAGICHCTDCRKITARYPSHLPHLTNHPN